jgi:putative phosphoribosyl transferase
VAEVLDAPLDIMVVRKLGAPFQRELGVGAIAEDGVGVLNARLAQALHLTDAEVDDIVEREEAELERRVRRYRGDRAPLEVDGRLVVLVDDGIATGFTAMAGARALRKRGASRIVLAVPVGPPQVDERLGGEVDEVVCLESPPGFFAVGAYYEHFDQVSDEEVIDLLRPTPSSESRTAPEVDPPRAHGGLDWAQVTHREVAIPSEAGVVLPGDVRLPPGASGLVIFAHGSGSSRLSPRNVQVAAALGAAGFGTLLFDLLGEEEAADRRKVFDIPLLARRLVSATRWAKEDEELTALPIGYFGASTGAAAALCAAADLGGSIGAVVSRGGRPDLAAARLRDVSAPTLLIVGGADRAVIQLNQEAELALACLSKLVIVPGASHLFEEPGALEQVADYAADWFSEHLRTEQASTPR